MILSKKSKDESDLFTGLNVLFRRLHASYQRS